MLKRKFMAFCMALLAFSGSAQVTAKDSVSGEAVSLAVVEVLNQVSKNAKMTNEFFYLFGLTYLRTNVNLYGDGLNFTSLRPSSFSIELGYMPDFKEHTIHKMDIGLNYALNKNL